MKPYDLVCAPRQIKDIKKVNFDLHKIPNIIRDTLRCSICLEIFNDPVNIKNCLHKFCRKCVEDYNRKMYIILNLEKKNVPYVDNQLKLDGF